MPGSIPPAAGFCLSTSWKGWALRPYPDPMRNALTRIPYRLHPNGKHFIIRPIRDFDRIWPGPFCAVSAAALGRRRTAFPCFKQVRQERRHPFSFLRHLVMSSFFNDCYTHYVLSYTAGVEPATHHPKKLQIAGIPLNQRPGTGESQEVNSASVRQTADIYVGRPPVPLTGACLFPGPGILPRPSIILSPRLLS